MHEGLQHEEEEDSRRNGMLTFEDGDGSGTELFRQKTHMEICYMKIIAQQ